MLANINKVHSTRMSLNERFTAIASKRIKPLKPSPSVPTVNEVASLENRKLLQELIRRDKMRAALKLKRRSMRTVGSADGCSRAILRVNKGIPLKRGTVKALRIAANGFPIKANSMSRVATMNADLVSVRSRRQNFLRSNSIANRLGGLRRRRSVEEVREIVNRGVDTQRIGRLRSRSRVRMAANQTRVARGRSRSRTRFASVDGRSLRRGRSRTRREMAPIQARLGMRPRNSATTAPISSRKRSQNRLRRRPSLVRLAVAQGRVQKIRGGGRAGRSRGRVPRGGTRSRSQSRNGRASRGQQLQQSKLVLRSNGSRVAKGRRERSQQRGRNKSINGKQVANAGNQQEQSQQLRGRSRSRGRRGIGRNQGQKTNTQTLSKDDLDKELDQYMMTTKTQNNIDYLLAN